MTRRPLTVTLAPLTTALVFGVAATLWYFRPERAAPWLAAMGVLTVGWGVHALLSRRVASRRGKNAGSDLDTGPEQIRQAITMAGLILLVPLALTLGTELGFLGETVRKAISTRAVGVIIGAILAVYGNAIPKMLTPVSLRRCEPSGAQRFTGWVFALAGVFYALAWLALPVVTARAVSFLIAAGGVLLVLLRLLQSVVKRRHAPPPARA